MNWTFQDVCFCTKCKANNKSSIQKKNGKERPTLKTLVTESLMDLTYLQSTITVLLICLFAFICFCFALLLLLFFLLFLRKKACAVRDLATVLLLFPPQNLTNTIPYRLYLWVIYFFEREKRICNNSFTKRSILGRFWAKTSIKSEWELEKVGQLFQVLIHIHPCHSWQWQTVNSLRAII